MLNSNELINLIKKYNPKCDEDLIARAYDYGKNYHEGQFRASGEKYFNHPIEVAKILIGQRLDDETIASPEKAPIKHIISVFVIDSFK